MKKQLAANNSIEKQLSETKGTQQKENPEEPSTMTLLLGTKAITVSHDLM